MPKLIFLDLDGVINVLPGSPRSREQSRELAPFPVLTECIGRLNQLIQQHSCELILSTDWRKWHSIQELQSIFTSIGIHGKIVGKTPTFHKLPRGFEIQSWLRDNYQTELNLVILDDREDIMPLSQFHIWTDPKTGLTDANLTQASQILNDEKLQSSLYHQLFVDTDQLQRRKFL